MSAAQSSDDDCNRSLGKKRKFDLVDDLDSIVDSGIGYDYDDDNIELLENSDDCNSLSKVESTIEKNIRFDRFRDFSTFKGLSKRIKSNDSSLKAQKKKKKQKTQSISRPILEEDHAVFGKNNEIDCAQCSPSSFQDLLSTREKEQSRSSLPKQSSNSSSSLNPESSSYSSSPSPSSPASPSSVLPTVQTPKREINVAPFHLSQQPGLPQQDVHQNKISMESIETPLHVLEGNWLKRNGFKEYVYEHNYKNGMVIYSHETKKRYFSNFGNPLYLSSLSEFKNTGHTFCIDCEYSYIRPLSFDLDCVLCHNNFVRDMEEFRHVDEIAIKKFIQALKRKINPINANVQIAVFSREGSHNKHIYTNLVVSMSLHSHLVYFLKNELENDNQYIIDFPKFMPLPYSLKRIDGISRHNSPYREQYECSLSPSVFLVIPEPNCSFYDNYRLCKEKEITDDEIEVLRLQSNNVSTDSMVYVYMRNIAFTKTIPMISSVYTQIFLKNSDRLPELVKDSIRDYFIRIIDLFLANHRARFENNGAHVDYKAINKDKNVCLFIANYRNRMNCFFNKLNKCVFQDGAPERPNIKSATPLIPYFEIHGSVKSQNNDDRNFNKENDDDGDDNEENTDDDDDDEIDSTELRAKIIGIYNSDRSRENDECLEDDNDDADVTTKVVIRDGVFNVFVMGSIYKHGGMHMQHFVVALHKALNLDKHDVDKFRHFLNVIYKNSSFKKLESNKPKFVDYFLKNYCVAIEKSYLCNSDEILDYMSLVNYHNITVDMTVHDVFNTILLSTLNTKTIEMYYVQHILKKGKISQFKFDKFRDIVIELIRRLRIFVLYTGFTYLLENKYWIYVKTSPTTSPGMLFCKWPSVLFEKMRLIINKPDHAFNFNVSQFTHSIPYMIATECGVFNSITGLYVSHTPLISFAKRRRYILYPSIPERELQSETTTNENIIKFRSNYSKFFYELITKNLHTLYTHYLYVPAIISLRFVYELHSSDIIRFFNIAVTYDVSEANFLIELYPFKRNLVAYILNIISIYGHETICNYDRLCHVLFNSHNPTTVTEDDWRDNYNIMMKSDFEEVLTAFSHAEEEATDDVSFSTILTSYDDGKIKFTVQECVLGVSMLAALFKETRYVKFFTAFGYNNAPNSNNMPKPNSLNVVHDWDNVESYTPSSKTCIKLTKRAKDLVLMNRSKNKNRQIDSVLFTSVLQLVISASFDKHKCIELLNMMSVSMVNTNVLKLMLIFHGPKDAGKTYILDILSYALEPFVFASTCKKLDKQNERAAVLSKNLMIRCNEMQSIDSLTLKAFTGEDANSSQVFYHQGYEMNNIGQGLFYVGTNYYILFQDEDSKRRTTADPVLIQRLHAISLQSGHYYDSSVFDGKSSLFTMAANMKFFIGTNVMNNDRRHFAFMWLLFENYYNTRDPVTHNPRVNLTLQDSVYYRQVVYCLNSAMYRVLNKCDLCYEVGFKILKSRFIEAISYCVTDSSSTFNVVGGNQFSNNSSVSMDKLKFYRSFQDMYSVDLESLQDDAYILNFQFINLVKRIMDDFRVEWCDGANITEADLEKKLQRYVDLEDRQQAKEYFMRNNVKFMLDTDLDYHVLKNYKFINDDDDDDNENDNSINRLDVNNATTNVNTIEPVISSFDIFDVFHKK